MTALADTSLLSRFLEFMARSSSALAAADAGSADDLRHELDSFIALATAAYAELAALTREMTADAPPGEIDERVARIREAHARYFLACKPVVGLIESAQKLGVAPKRVEDFLATVGEA